MVILQIALGWKDLSDMGSVYQCKSLALLAIFIEPLAQAIQQDESTEGVEVKGPEN